MKYSFNIKSFATFIIAAFVLTSCVARQPYERPKVVDESLFRTDRIPQDSLNMANLSWRQVFTDPVLQNHIQEALTNNLDVRMAGQNILIAEAYLKQSKAAYFPTLSAGANHTFQTQSMNTQFGRIVGERRYINQFDLTGQVGWEIDLWGKLKAQEKAQLANYLSTVAGHQRVKSDLVASVANLYYQLLALDEQKKIVNNTILVRKKNLETTQALKNAGTLTEVAVQQSQALVYNAEAMLIDMDTQIRVLENAMGFLLSKPSQEISRTSLSQQQMIVDLDVGYPMSLLANRPDVMSAEYQFMNAFLLTQAAKANFYPTLRITGSTGLQSIELADLFSVNAFFANLVSGLTQPIFAKRQIRSEYEASVARKESALMNFQKSVLNAGREVSDALAVYQAQDNFVNKKQQEFDAYQKSVDYAQQLVNYGMANYLEVLNASVAQLNAELNITNAKYNKLKAGVELYQALGGGWR